MIFRLKLHNVIERVHNGDPNDKIYIVILILLKSTHCCTDSIGKMHNIIAILLKRTPCYSFNIEKIC
jgi:hypothetical protein